MKKTTTMKTTNKTTTTKTTTTKGQMGTPKSMNFQKNSKRPLTPPSLSENHVTDFATKVRTFATKVRDFATKVCMFIIAGLLCII